MGVWCDDISCVAFCLATTVTAQFWALHYITGGLVERSSDRPEWLGFAVHVLNSILAWVDVAVARPRTFSPRARIMCAGFAGFYSVFICVCRRVSFTPFPGLTCRCLRKLRVLPSLASTCSVGGFGTGVTPLGLRPRARVAAQRRRMKCDRASARFSTVGVQRSAAVQRVAGTSMADTPTHS